MPRGQGSHLLISLPIQILVTGGHFFAVKAYSTPNISTNTRDYPACHWNITGRRFNNTQQIFGQVASISSPVRPCGGAALGTDGGVPITIAEELGYDRFLVVLTREREYQKAPEKFPRFYLAYFRKYPAVADALLTRWWRYNQTREKLFDLQRAGKAYLFTPEVMPVANGERNVGKLNAAHELGLAQARREMPAIKEFLGLA